MQLDSENELLGITFYTYLTTTGHIYQGTGQSLQPYLCIG